MSTNQIGNQTVSPAAVVREEEMIDLTAWLTSIRDHWKALLVAFLLSSTIGVVVALLVPKEFTATATILPSESKSPALSLLSQFGGATGLGIGGGGVMSDLFPNVARSRAVAGKMLDAHYADSTFRAAITEELDLDKTGAEREEMLMRHLAKSLSVSVDPLTSVAKVSYTSHSPKLAAALVNEIVHNMDEFFRARMKSDSRDESQLIMQRLADEQDSLRVAEQRLLEFRERNRAYQLSPTALLEQERLVRQMQIHSTLYVELTKQFEIARIEEYRTTPVLTVLDWAVPPVKKSGPKRSLYALFIAFVGTVGTLLTVKVRDGRREAAREAA